MPGLNRSVARYRRGTAPQRIEEPVAAAGCSAGAGAAADAGAEAGGCGSDFEQAAAARTVAATMIPLFNSIMASTPFTCQATIVIADGAHSRLTTAFGT